MKADTDVICIIAELEVIDDMVQTDLDNNGREIETLNQQAYSEIYATKVTDIKNDEKDEFNHLQIQSGNTQWKKGERPRILPLGSMASTAQIHFPFKSRDLSGYKRYMEDNVNKTTTSPRVKAKEVL